MPGETVSVRLSSAQLQHISQAPYLPVEIRRLAEAAVRPANASNKALLDIEAETADQFQSAFTDRLAQAGFDSNYELTEEGVLLEDLIDAFSGPTR